MQAQSPQVGTASSTAGDVDGSEDGATTPGRRGQVLAAHTSKSDSKTCVRYVLHQRVKLRAVTLQAESRRAFGDSDRLACDAGFCVRMSRRRGGHGRISTTWRPKHLTLSFGLYGRSGSVFDHGAGPCPASVCRFPCSFACLRVVRALRSTTRSRWLQANPHQVISVTTHRGRAGDWMGELKNGATQTLDKIGRLPGIQRTYVLCSASWVPCDLG